MEILRRRSMRVFLWALLLIGTIAAPAKHAGEEAGLRCWKGDLHTHTFWSDGDDFPDVVVQRYREHGYRFLTLSDHNVLSQGQRWIVVTDAEDREIRTTRHSRDIGAVLAEVEGVLARYPFQDDEVYVRAKVISSHKSDKTHVPDEWKSAWVQPVIVRP